MPRPLPPPPTTPALVRRGTALAAALLATGLAAAGCAATPTESKQPETQPGSRPMPTSPQPPPYPGQEGASPRPGPMPPPQPTVPSSILSPQPGPMRPMSPQMSPPVPQPPGSGSPPPQMQRLRLFAMASRRARMAKRAREQAPLELSPAWMEWLVESALAGVGPAELAGALSRAGVSPQRARREIALLVGSRLFAKAREARAEAARLGLVTKLLREAAQASPFAGAIERRSGVAPQELRTRYLATATPVILTDWLAGWPALERWSLDQLRARFGGVEVEVMTGDVRSRGLRDRGPDHRRKLPLSALLDHLASSADAPSLSLEAYNRALELPGLLPMLDDVRLDEALFDAAMPGGISLWLGPKGAFTPLHHDTTNILFCQIVGKKKLSLVSPLATSLLDNLRGMWAGGTLAELAESGAHDDVMVLETELVAGEALFLPGGFWHEVEALEPSLHLSVLCFRDVPDLSFYLPGEVP